MAYIVFTSWISACKCSIAVKILMPRVHAAGLVHYCMLLI